MTPDAVFDLLVAADPVPDPGARPGIDPSAPPPWSSSPHAPVLEFVAEPTPTPAEAARRRLRWATAAAAAAIVVAAVAALTIDRGGRTPIDRADESAPTPAPTLTREAQAVETAERFYDALNAGDVETMVAMTNPDFSVVDADRRMWEMNAVRATGGAPWTIGACEPVSVGTSIEVACEVTIGDPVFAELGVDELIAPVRVFDDQTTRWLPFRGGDFEAANRAYAEYLQAYRSDDYDDVCDPAAHDPGTINASGGLALTAECGELWGPLDDDVAQWIRDGRP